MKAFRIKLFPANNPSQEDSSCKSNTCRNPACWPLCRRRGAAQAQNVVLYSSNNTETIETALEAVKKKSPSLNVQPVTGGTGTMMKRIEAEAQNPRGDSVLERRLRHAGRLPPAPAAVPPGRPDKIPAEFRGPDDCGSAPTCT